jgi:hypothetical protein
MTLPLVMLVDDEAPFVETMTKASGKKRFERHCGL